MWSIFSVAISCAPYKIQNLSGPQNTPQSTPRIPSQNQSTEKIQKIYEYRGFSFFFFSVFWFREGIWGAFGARGVLDFAGGAGDHNFSGNAFKTSQNKKAQNISPKLHHILHCKPRNLSSTIQVCNWWLQRPQKCRVNDYPGALFCIIDSVKLSPIPWSCTKAIPEVCGDEILKRLRVKFVESLVERFPSNFRQNLENWHKFCHQSTATFFTLKFTMSKESCHLGSLWGPSRVTDHEWFLPNSGYVSDCVCRGGGGIRWGGVRSPAGLRSCTCMLPSPCVAKISRGTKQSLAHLQVAQFGTGKTGPCERGLGANL